MFFLNNLCQEVAFDFGWRYILFCKTEKNSISLGDDSLMARTEWFKEARFGLFLHWGLYAVAGKGEWAYANFQWKKNEYESMINHFDPIDYDPDDWVKMAKEAGMKYIVLTTRHHDGFCMFDSHYTDYKITNTPYGKDVVRMFADACRKQGMRVGFYHSLPDWTHRGYADPESPEHIQYGKLHTPTPEEYLNFIDLLNNHIRQLLSEYGKIDLLFLDYTSQYKADTDYFQREKLLEMIYRLQPEILVNDRLSFYKENAPDFDYYTPEVCVPNQPLTVKGRDVPWETCASMNDHWGYFTGDNNYKSVTSIIANLLGCVAKNGNLLLNIGPDQFGKFPAGAVENLKLLAEWIKANGEAVHGCSQAEYTPPFGCVYTQKGNVLYCSFLVQPAGDVILPQLRNKIKKITLLRTGTEIEMINNWGWELLKEDEQRIRPKQVQVSDVIKIELL